MATFETVCMGKPLSQCIRQSGDMAGGPLLPHDALILLGQLTKSLFNVDRGEKWFVQWWPFIMTCPRTLKTNTVSVWERNQTGVYLPLEDITGLFDINYKHLNSRFKTFTVKIIPSINFSIVYLLNPPCRYTKQRFIELNTIITPCYVPYMAEYRIKYKNRKGRNGINKPTSMHLS